MSNLQKELASEARLFLEEILAKDPVIEPILPVLSIYLIGSGVTQYASEYSGVDLLILVPEEARNDVAAAIEGLRHRSRLKRWRTPRPRSPRRYQVESIVQWTAQVQSFEDEAVYWMKHGVLLHDPSRQGEKLREFTRNLPKDLWCEKSLRSYRELRRRKASLAWSLRRGHQLVVLDNLVQILYQTLNICFYLQEEVPVPRKWLFRGALRTEFGSRIRGIFYELFRSFSDLTTLGGSDNLQLNKIYQLISRIQTTIEDRFVLAGWKTPVKQKEGEGRF